MENQNSSRRPIASRDSGWARKTAAALASAGLTPNFISVLSIVFAAVSLVAFVLWKDYGLSVFVAFPLAIIGIQGRLVMNLFDGMVAVEYGKKSAVGGLYNEVPDRVSDTFILIGAGYAVSDMQFGMTLAWIAVCLSVATAYIRTLGASLGTPHYFIGPMAKQHRMALLTLACVVALFYVPAIWYALIVMNVGLVVTCLRRLSKIAHYLNTNFPVDNG